MLVGGGVEKLDESLNSGYYIQPTLLKGNNSMRVFQEEIFGPVIGITTFKDEQLVQTRPALIALPTR